MTAVGAIAGLGLAGGDLDLAVMGEIVVWWVVSPIIGFWVSLVIDRYFYARLNRMVAMERSDGPLLAWDLSGALPVPRTHRTTNRRELVGTVTVIAIGCLMAFSPGTSNIANAVAPLVGSCELKMNPATILGGIAVTVGAFTIARRTLETMSSDITELPLTAAIIVASVSSALVVFLSALAANEEGEELPPIGEEDPKSSPTPGTCSSPRRPPASSSYRTSSPPSRRSAPTSPSGSSRYSGSEW